MGDDLVPWRLPGVPPTIDPTPYRVSHEFLGAHHDRNARRTWIVVAITFVMMVVEITAGVLFGSMALLADGVHMATHAGALSIAALAYQYARRHQHDSRFAFGTGKVGDLAGFASALALGLVAIVIAVESVGRLLNPVPVAFGDAILVAVIGLVVNLVSAMLLGHSHGDEGHEEPDQEHAGAQESRGQHHAHEGAHREEAFSRDSGAGADGGHDADEHHDHDHHDHAHHHADHNLLAAYVHVLADAFTSVLAIVALVAGRYLGWVWLDAAMGIVGAIIILRWAYSLTRQTSRVLLDSADPALLKSVKNHLERDGACVSDLHIWRLGPGHSAVVATVVCPAGNKPDYFKQRLSCLPTLSHVTVEVLEPKR
jgi:cation diffusion facilitator family transporter